jgi:hypothetical protein
MAASVSDVEIPTPSFLTPSEHGIEDLNPVNFFPENQESVPHNVSDNVDKDSSCQLANLKVNKEELLSLINSLGLKLKEDENLCDYVKSGMVDIKAGGNGKIVLLLKGEKDAFNLLPLITVENIESAVLYHNDVFFQTSSLNNWLKYVKRIATSDSQTDAVTVDLTKLSTAQKSGASVVLKTGPSNTYALRSESTVMVGMNSLRIMNPNFAVGFGLISCAISDQYKLKVMGICSNPKLASSNTSLEALMMECIDTTLDLEEIINLKPLKLPLHFSIICQTLMALELAQKEKHLTHYDLHGGNIMVEKIEDNDAVFVYYYPKKAPGTLNDIIIVPTYGLCAKIIDFGYSYSDDLIGKGMACYTTLVESGIAPHFDSVYDIHRLLTYLTYKYKLMKEVTTKFKTKEAKAAKGMIDKFIKCIDAQFPFVNSEGMMKMSNSFIPIVQIRNHITTEDPVLAGLFKEKKVTIGYMYGLHYLIKYPPRNLTGTVDFSVFSRFMYKMHELYPNGVVGEAAKKLSKKIVSIISEERIIDSEDTILRDNIHSLREIIRDLLPHLETLTHDLLRMTKGKKLEMYKSVKGMTPVVTCRKLMKFVPLDYTVTRKTTFYIFDSVKRRTLRVKADDKNFTKAEITRCNSGEIRVVLSKFLT